MDTYVDCRRCGADAYLYFADNGYEICAECGHRRNYEDPWFTKAACRGMDANLWHPERGQTGDLGYKAKQVCAGCEVAEKCLAYAMTTNQDIGIWGGLTPIERKRLRRRLGTVTKRHYVRSCPGCGLRFKTTVKSKTYCDRRCYNRQAGHPATRTSA